jgi:chitin disaccharide deacetylase
MSQPRIPIALCADDYGQHQGIDDAIINLLAAKRLTAVSCFSTAPRWQMQSAPLLREHLGVADLGLHLNLSENFGRPATSLPQLIARSHLHLLDRDQVRTALQHQCDEYEKAMGCAPDFIDGHQHVHQLPLVREVLLETLIRRYAGLRIWVRNTVPAHNQWRGKALILKHLGGTALATYLMKAKIATNQGFAGVYGFDTENYSGQVAEWLKHAQKGMLMMCHPGTAAPENDPIGAQRPVEYRFLSSPDFSAMLDMNGVELKRLSEILP